MAVSCVRGEGLLCRLTVRPRSISLPRDYLFNIIQNILQHIRLYLISLVVLRQQLFLSFNAQLGMTLAPHSRHDSCSCDEVRDLLVVVCFLQRPNLLCSLSFAFCSGQIFFASCRLLFAAAKCSLLVYSYSSSTYHRHHIIVIILTYFLIGLYCVYLLAMVVAHLFELCQARSHEAYEG